MNTTDSHERPSVPMSQEEHTSISELTRNVGELTVSVRGLSDNQGRLEKIVMSLAESTSGQFERMRTKGELSWEKIGALIMVAMPIGGAIWALNTLHITNENAPRDKAAAVQEERVAELYFKANGHYPKN